MPCKIGWNLDVCMLISSVTDIVHWLTTTKVNLTLKDSLRVESSLFLSVTIFLELMPY